MADDVYRQVARRFEESAQARQRWDAERDRAAAMIRGGWVMDLSRLWDAVALWVALDYATGPRDRPIL